MNVVHPSHCPEIGPICQQRDEPPQLHDQVFYVTELRPVAELQVLDWLSFEAQLPLRLSATTIVYRRLDGAPFVPDYEDIHHRNETLLGPADPWLSVRGHLVGLDPRLTAQLGVTLPLGRTEPNPFALGAQGLPHQHVQFGTGTFNPILGLEALRTAGPIHLRAHAVALLPLLENRHGYRAGARIVGGLEGAFSLDRWRLTAGVHVFHEEPERWDGAILQDGNLGRTDLLLGAAAAYPLGEYLVGASLQVPVYQRLVQAGHEAGQLTYPAIVGISVQRVFDLLPR